MIFQVLVLVILLTVGIVLVVLGAKGLRRRNGLSPRILSVVSLLLGITLLSSLAIYFIGRGDLFGALGSGLAVTLSLAALAFWMYILAECALLEEKNSLDKLTWVLIIIFLPVLGALIYFFGRRPRRIQESGK